MPHDLSQPTDPPLSGKTIVAGNTRYSSKFAYTDLFSKNATISFEMDLSEAASSINTAYMVFPGQCQGNGLTSHYYCDIANINNSTCMELDLIEVYNNQFIQTTAHECHSDPAHSGSDYMSCQTSAQAAQPDSLDWCGYNGCHECSDKTIDDAFGNEKKLNIQAKFSENGTFKVIATNSNQDSMTIEPEYKIKETNDVVKYISDNNPGVFVTSNWTPTGAWLPCDAQSAGGSAGSHTISNLKCSYEGGEECGTVSIESNSESCTPVTPAPPTLKPCSDYGITSLPSGLTDGCCVQSPDSSPNCKAASDWCSTKDHCESCGVDVWCTFE